MAAVHTKANAAEAHKLPQNAVYTFKQHVEMWFWRCGGRWRRVLDVREKDEAMTKAEKREVNARRCKRGRTSNSCWGCKECKVVTYVEDDFGAVMRA